jgi:hypothetical protein
MTQYVYVLKLQDGKYYAGKSSEPDRRFLEHKYGTASEWTKQYKPIMPAIQEIPITSEHDETNITIDLMKKYGIDNVRGGPWTSVVLTKDEKSFIQKQIHSESDECYGCGQTDHFVKECPSKVQRSNTLQCFGCQETGHFVKDCPSKLQIKEEITLKKKVQDQDLLDGNTIQKSPKMKKIPKARKILKKMKPKKREKNLMMDLHTIMMEREILKMKQENQNLRMSMKKMNIK